MNSNPYMLPAFIIVVAVLIGCGGWLYLSVTQPSGQHARRREPNTEGARFGAYLRGDPEPPEGAPVQDRSVLAELDAARGILAADPERIWWHEGRARPEGAAEILTGPGTANPQASDAFIGTLARVRDALLPDAWQPEPAAATFTPADPDATRFDLQPVPDVIP